jgi:hypothetical protein
MLVGHARGRPGRSVGGAEDRATDNSGKDRFDREGETGSGVEYGASVLAVTFSDTFAFVAFGFHRS